MQIQLLSGIDNPAYMREYVLVAESDQELKRAGVLIGAKIDMFQISRLLRWGYLPDATLKGYGLSEEQIKSLKTALRKAEELYEDQNGSRLQFARAILEGAGNMDGLVKVDYQTLGNIAVSFQEQILQSTPYALLKAIKSQTAGLGSLDNSAQSVNKASDTLSKIGGIAQNIATISNGLASSVGSSSTPAPQADINTPPQKAGIADWMSNNKAVTAGGLLLLAGMAVTQFKMPKEDLKKYKKAVKRTGLAGHSKPVKKTNTNPGRANPGRANPGRANKKKTLHQKHRQSLGFVELM